jgi:hypothetical protein
MFSDSRKSVTRGYSFKGVVAPILHLLNGSYLLQSLLSLLSVHSFHLLPAVLHSVDCAIAMINRACTLHALLGRKAGRNSCGHSMAQSVSGATNNCRVPSLKRSGACLHSHSGTLDTVCRSVTVSVTAVAVVLHSSLPSSLKEPARVVVQESYVLLEEPARVVSQSWAQPVHCLNNGVSDCAPAPLPPKYMAGG